MAYLFEIKNTKKIYFIVSINYFFREKKSIVLLSNKKNIKKRSKISITVIIFVKTKHHPITVMLRKLKRFEQIIVVDPVRDGTISIAENGAPSLAILNGMEKFLKTQLSASNANINDWVLF
jgi:hypothetical protein